MNNIEQINNIEQNVHPSHYGGENNLYEVIKVLEAWGMDHDAYLWNVIKYIARAGHKAGNPPLQDLKKAAYYLNRRIESLEGGSGSINQADDGQDERKAKING